jgi:drug/metabolite transporter (DMT)-like permease
MSAMKTFGVMALACLVSSLGDAFMSRGMHQVGDVSAGLSKLPSMFQNRLVWISIACSAAYFFLYSSTLSWAKLSVAQPLNAMTFVFAAVLARFYLGESLSTPRLLGILLITAGVALVSWDQA